MVKPIENQEPSEYYDEREFVQREIDPLLAEIHGKCSERNIPCIFLVESRNNEETITESTGCVIPAARQTPRMRALATLIQDMRAVAKMAALAELIMSVEKGENPDVQSESPESSKREPLQ